MAAVYPTDYPFHVDEEGWPEPVYAPPYPFEYYYDHGRDSRSTSEENHLHANDVVPLTIRRHTPGTADPNLAQLSSRSRSPAINPRLTNRRNPSQPSSRPTSFQRHSSVSTDPDERPIKPMKDTSVYHQSSSSQNKPFQPKKPPAQTSKPIQTPSRFESNSFRTPPPISHTPVKHNTARRPILIDLIPKIPIGIPPPRTRSRRIVVEEYEDNAHPVTYVQPLPKKILSYRQVTGKTTRELENDQMSRTRRTVRVRSPPVERIIYQT